MELLRLVIANRDNNERGMWLVVRGVLDAGEDPQTVSGLLGISAATMYRRLREQGLTYGRGRVGE